MFEKIFLFVLSLLGPRFKLVLGVLALAVVAVVSIAGFRGEKTRRPPIEIFPDTDRQFKLRPETTAGFYAWANNMSSRPQVAGTVAQRHGRPQALHAVVELHHGHHVGRPQAGHHELGTAPRLGQRPAVH